jgi:hypothetical protein
MKAHDGVTTGIFSTVSSPPRGKTSKRTTTRFRISIQTASDRRIIFIACEPRGKARDDLFPDQAVTRPANPANAASTARLDRVD